MPEKSPPGPPRHSAADNPFVKDLGGLELKQREEVRTFPRSIEIDFYFLLLYLTLK